MATLTIGEAAKQGGPVNDVYYQPQGHLNILVHARLGKQNEAPDGKTYVTSARFIKPDLDDWHKATAAQGYFVDSNQICAHSPVELGSPLEEFLTNK